MLVIIFTQEYKRMTPYEIERERMERMEKQKENGCIVQ